MAVLLKTWEKRFQNLPSGSISALATRFKSSKYRPVFLRFEPRGRLDLEPD